jgi:endonuclease YncB( thermonuclease family)
LSGLSFWALLQPMKLVLALGLALLAAPAGAATLSGPALVIDGDTLEIEGRRVRLFGIDAPELSQSCDRNGESWACGQTSAEQLRAMIGDYALTCDGHEVDVYGRLLAVCRLGGVDLNRTMVAEGWATAFRRYSEDYVADEGRARASRLGLWSSSFISPEDYRMAEDATAQTSEQQQRAQSVSRTVPATASSCAIKGNRSRGGDWIYHLPGMPYYNETRAEEMFCTEAEAMAAGYRRSRAR